MRQFVIDLMILAECRDRGSTRSTWAVARYLPANIPRADKPNYFNVCPCGFYPKYFGIILVD